MKQEGIKRYLVLSSIAILLSIFIFGFTSWMVMNFGDVTFDQYYFGIISPTAGTPMSYYITIMKYMILVILATVLIVFGYAYVLKHLTHSMRIKKMGLGLLTVVCFISSIGYMSRKLKVGSYLFGKETQLYETHYVLPTSDIVTFPKQKKNLIFIYLESYESTYFSKELGGNIEHNLLPNLTEILADGSAVNFSNKESYGGAQQAPDTGYSMAGMFASLSGLPFKVPLKGVHYDKPNEFAKGTITLGDILKQEGYRLEFLMGVDGIFAGVSNFYQTHGDFNILDHARAQKEGLIPEDYKVWWGFEDRKLFEFSKQKLEAVSQSDQPFAMIIETVDSHFPDGYTDAACARDFDEPYENSIACVDRMVSDFIQYVQKQPYYEDTVIMLFGDHLSMDKGYFKTLDPDYERTTLNAFINVDEALVTSVNNKNRKMYTMDIFPTTLAAMNVKIKGDRLGIGTNLWSSQETLYESLGVEAMNREISKRSKYYDHEFLFKRSTYK